jgi:hypothetical protein
MNEQEKSPNEVTPAGAVEVDDEDLDQAAGGMSSGGDMPAAYVSQEMDKIGGDKAGQKAVPENPSIAVLSDPHKKI